MESQERAYSTKEVSHTLGIGDSTLRKWCLALEKNGYTFIKNEREQRLFIESDLVCLRHFQTLVQQHNMQLENAAIVVVDRFGKGAFEEGTGHVPAEQPNENRSFPHSDDLISKLLKHIKQQETFNQELLKRPDQQQQYIEERLNKRDETLIQSLREVQETKKMIAATEEKKKEESKKSFLSRLFGQ